MATEKVMASTKAPLTVVRVTTFFDPALMAFSLFMGLLTSSSRRHLYFGKRPEVFRGIEASAAASARGCFR